MLAAMDGEAAERDWLGVQCAVLPEVAKRFDGMRRMGP